MSKLYLENKHSLFSWGGLCWSYFIICNSYRIEAKNTLTKQQNRAMEKKKQGIV